MTGIVYRVISPSGKIYIGQTTKTLKKRKAVHKSRAFGNFKKQSKSFFHNALKKYGFENFSWEILYQNIPENMLDIAEICAIYINNSYGDGYNLTEGGEGSRGIFISDNVREKISKNNCRYWSGKNHSEESKKKMSEMKRGKNHPNFDKKLSEETKRKIGEKNKISLKGKVPWNKGLTKEIDSRVRKISDSLSRYYKRNKK